jgi:hypothetical protein
MTYTRRIIVNHRRSRNILSVLNRVCNPVNLKCRTRKRGLTEGTETGGLFRMVSRMMQAEATRNTGVNIDTFMNILGRYYQIRDDYQDIKGTVLLPLFQNIISLLIVCTLVSRKVCTLLRSRPRELHTTHYPHVEIPRRDR